MAPRRHGEPHRELVWALSLLHVLSRHVFKYMSYKTLIESDIHHDL